MKKNRPPVLRFASRLVRNDDRSKMLVEIPKRIARKLRGMATLEGTINDHPFRAPLEQNASNAYFVIANQAMLRGARAGSGDTVELSVLGREPKLRIPADLRAAFTPKAETVWSELTDLGRRDWVRWIESAKTPQTRARRVQRTIDQLSEGKRRACCVNVYEYMLGHVRE